MVIQKTTKELYNDYISVMRKIADIKMAAGVLQWDQETYMPVNGYEIRGQQIATLSELSHDLFAEEKIGNMLNDLVGKDDLSPDQKRNVELTLEDFDKNKKYTSDFVRTLSEQVNKAFHAWIESRKHNSFAIFEKELDPLIQLKKQEAEMLGYEHHPYNALLNEFEKGCTISLLDRTFGDLLPFLKDLYDKVRAKPRPDDSFLHQDFPRQQQWDWGMHIIKNLHFDFNSGRQDISEHPFSTSFNNKDVRITTRIDEKDFSNMTWSCIHETGHALYEQGLPAEHYGLPLGEACSYSIHESQSRLWENSIGRSSSFWQYYLPELKKFFPSRLTELTPELFYSGINKVQPTFIRTEADELTYHFHVFIRYELEKKLIEGSIKTAEIPFFWNEHYKKHLGVQVPDDKQGCLQDVHWSHGSFGYFPTYSLGSFYAAQFFATAQKQIDSLDKELKNGNTTELLAWLRRNIHQHGRKYTSEELCTIVTGKSLEIAYFVDYLLEKYRVIYKL